MKVYELIFNANSVGVYRISAVKDPAIEETLVKFSNEKPLLFAIEERKEFFSIAMRPDKMIFRKEVNGEPANVFYSAETVAKLQQNYFRNSSNSNTNLHHTNENAKGIFPFESWIVEDPASDKSTLMGLNTQKGDWVMGYKVDDDAIWQDVKDGKIDGLSIEASLEHKEQIKNNYKMTKTSIWEMAKAAIKKIAMESDRQELKVGEETYFATEFTEGNIVTDVDGNPIANAEFEFEGKTLKTDDMGAILPDKKVEVETVEAAEDGAAPTDELQTLKDENQMLKDKVATLEEELAVIEAEKVKAETALETMAKHTMSAQRIKNAPTTTVKSYSEMTNFEKLKFNREK